MLPAKHVTGMVCNIFSLMPCIFTIVGKLWDSWSRQFGSLGTPHHCTAVCQHFPKPLYRCLFLPCSVSLSLCCHSHWVCVRASDGVMCVTKLLFHDLYASASLDFILFYSHFSSFFNSALSGCSTHLLRLWSLPSHACPFHIWLLKRKCRTYLIF